MSPEVATGRNESEKFETPKTSDKFRDRSTGKALEIGMVSPEPVRLIPFCKDVVANVCRSTCGLASLVIPGWLATALTMSWARRVLTGNAFSSAKWCSRSARTRLDIGTTRTLVFSP